MKNMGIIARKRWFLLPGLAFCLFVLVACGTNASTLTGSNGLAVSVTPVTVKQCGTVHTIGPQVISADLKTAKGVEDCFWQAYQQCTPATLIYSQGSVDTATIHTFSLRNQGGKCVITDTLQHVILPHAPRSGGSEICASLAQQADGLHFQTCNSEGNVLVPQGK